MGQIELCKIKPHDLALYIKIITQVFLLVVYVSLHLASIYAYSQQINAGPFTHTIHIIH